MSASTGRPAETELRAALADANVPTLLMVLVQLTGDQRWLAEPYRPSRSRGLDDNPTGGLAEADQAVVREAALRAVLRWADGTPPAFEVPDPGLLQRMMDVCVGERVPDEYGRMLTDDLTADQSNPAEPVPVTGPAVPATSPAGGARVAGFTVAVIGAGVSGLLAAVRLRQAGITATVFERGEDIGGTWLYNDYPGAGVDTPSYLYSFTFFPWDWSTHFGRRDEVLAYLRALTDHYGLRDRVELRTEVLDARYDEAGQGWQVHTRAGGVDRVRRYNAVITAVGQLNVPNQPDLPGLDTFDGPVFHSARWPAGLDLTGKRVAVIGTGASAMQIVPTLAPKVERLTVFQSSPHWVAPHADVFDEVPATMHFLMANVPFYRSWYRFRLGWIFNDRVHASLQVDPAWPHPDRSLNAANDRHREYFTNYLREQLAGREDLQAKTLPDYPPFGKRMLLDHGWYAALRRDNVDLVTDRAAELTAHTVRSAAGVEYPVDAVVLATGFQATRLIQTVELRGRSGESLRETWGDDDAWAYLGITTPGFPNLFMLYGPGTSAGSGGSYIFIAECQINYIVALLGKLLARSAVVAECRAEVSDAYNTRLDEAHAHMIWTHPGVTNYYRNAKGRVVTNSPWRFIDYWQLTRDPDLADFDLEGPHATDEPD